ncbi:hypothetical protein [Rhodoblastus sp.]|uniref:hypothetical protein n=1 Tax=Rhodoblastus sp. TaxID=1962975 RepID=UPI003F9A1E58
MMDDDRSPMMDDNHCFLDRGLNPLLQGRRRDGGGFGHAGDHAETQNGDDNAISAAFQCLGMIKNEHCICSCLIEGQTSVHAKNWQASKRPPSFPSNVKLRRRVSKAIAFFLDLSSATRSK